MAVRKYFRISARKNLNGKKMDVKIYEDVEKLNELIWLSLE
jgi:hypothetical protein